jgi:hypothetical protein
MFLHIGVYTLCQSDGNAYHLRRGFVFVFLGTFVGEIWFCMDVCFCYGIPNSTDDERSFWL